MQERMQAVLRRKHHELAIYIERIKGLSPLEKLNSGFSYVEDEKGCNVRSVAQVKEGQQLSIRVSDGVIDTQVTSVKKQEQEQFLSRTIKFMMQTV